MRSVAFKLEVSGAARGPKTYGRRLYFDDSGASESIAIRGLMTYVSAVAQEIALDWRK